MKNLSAHITRKGKFIALSILLAGGAGFQAVAQQEPLQPFKGKLGKTFEETQQAWPEFTKAKADSPNVIYILIDDIGFGAASAFGGLIPTPTFDSLANNGLRYTNFHTNGVCSPTRSGLLTGRNSHSVHIGSNSAAGTPGYDRYMPFEKSTIADILRENGYNTYAVGKWHLTPSSDLTQAGPFNRYPTGRGFDHYYGFLGGATDQYHPQLWDDTRKVELADNNKTHITTLLTNKAISFIAEQKSLAPEKPFFLYYAPGATHSPHQVDKSWVDKFKGKFDQGWDKYREDAVARQIKLGVVPANTVLPPKDKDVPHWNELSANEKKLAIRHFEVYAAFLAQTDYEVGRLINFLKNIHQLDNTLIYLSIGDNGASKAGTPFGRIKIYDPALTEEQRLQQSLKDIDLIGTEDSNSDYPLGWAQATNTPFRYFKADANSEGGTHNPLIVFWPKRIKERGIRTQYSHVTDITPTTLELVGAKVPTVINGYQQEPFEGTSLAYSIDNANAPTRKTVQYYEINGSRSIYKDGWKAAAYHVKGQSFDADKWELFNLNEDHNERFELSAKYPEKLKELRELFDAEAVKYNVYPLKDGTEPAPRTPTAFDGKSQFVFYPGISQITEVPTFINRSFAITAQAEIPAAGAEGVLLSLGGRPGGISFFVQNKQLHVVYNYGLDKKVISSKGALPTGKVELRYEFESDGDPAKATGNGTLFVNGVKVGEGRIAKPARGSAFEGLSIGKDIITPVADTYKAPYEFTGKLKSVTVELKERFNVSSR
ncbi:arylsulfatase [Chryseolinea serpens]|uniref:Arylsulfatase n=1 Tax=Chryseolinea serpens TaxID=947013 RepID=A0A1M5XTS2_9BACT|nr:arylsulfatase [Chryseolinea serpens]SHI03200.1 arylsulfatase [Chryseolinea serpens]